MAPRMRGAMTSTRVEARSSRKSGIWVSLALVKTLGETGSYTGGMTWAEFQQFMNDDLFAGVSPSEIVLFLVLSFAVFFASRFARKWIAKLLKKFPHVDEGTANAISTIVYYLALAIGVTWVASTLIDTSSLAVFTGALGLGIGLGFQDIAKNFISGIIMLLSKTIKPGDVISVDQELTGRVEDVGMYSSRMKTVLDATVIVPNSQILNEKFVNWTHDRKLRMLEIPVGVHYDSDLDVVQEILHDAAKRIDQVILDPAPRILLLNYGSSSVDFVARIWTDEVMYYQRVKSAYYLEVWRQFKERGVVIPYPQQDVYLKEIPSALAGQTGRAEGN